MAVKEFDNAREALAEIVRFYGVNGFADDQQLLQLFSETAPNLTREKLVLQAFVDYHHSNIQFIVSADWSAEEQKHLFDSTVRGICDATVMDETAVRSLCSDVAYVLWGHDPAASGKKKLPQVKTGKNPLAEKSKTKPSLKKVGKKLIAVAIVVLAAVILGVVFFDGSLEPQAKEALLIELCPQQPWYSVTLCPENTEDVLLDVAAHVDSAAMQTLFPILQNTPVTPIDADWGSINVSQPCMNLSVCDADYLYNGVVYSISAYQDGTVSMIRYESNEVVDEFYSSNIMLYINLRRLYTEISPESIVNPETTAAE